MSAPGSGGGSGWAGTVGSYGGGRSGGGRVEGLPRCSARPRVPSSELPHPPHDERTDLMTTSTTAALTEQTLVTAPAATLVRALQNRTISSRELLDAFLA